VSGNDSLPGSDASSPCDSPQPSSAKWGDGNPGAASAHHCRYFVVKAANNKMLQTAEQKGIWGTTSANEKKIASAFAVCLLVDVSRFIIIIILTSFNVFPLPSSRQMQSLL